MVLFLQAKVSILIRYIIPNQLFTYYPVILPAGRCIGNLTIYAFCLYCIFAHIHYTKRNYHVFNVIAFEERIITNICDSIGDHYAFKITTILEC